MPSERSDRPELLPAVHGVSLLDIELRKLVEVRKYVFWRLLTARGVVAGLGRGRVVRRGVMSQQNCAGENGSGCRRRGQTLTLVVGVDDGEAQPGAPEGHPGGEACPASADH
jgi:hypothetical protein